MKIQSGIWDEFTTGAGIMTEVSTARLFEYWASDRRGSRVSLCKVAFHATSAFFCIPKTFRTSKNPHVFSEEPTFVQNCIKGFERKVPVEGKGRNSFSAENVAYYYCRYAPKMDAAQKAGQKWNCPEMALEYINGSWIQIDDRLEGIKE